IRSKVLSSGDRGLLGLAFHPHYTSNGRFFVNYTRTGDGDTVISEFKVSASNPNIAESTEKIILTIGQQFETTGEEWLSSAPTVFFTSAWETEVVATTRVIGLRTSRSCSARCCALMWTRRMARRRTPPLRPIRFSDHRRGAMRFLPRGCATRG